MLSLVRAAMFFVGAMNVGGLRKKGVAWAGNAWPGEDGGYREWQPDGSRTFPLYWRGNHDYHFYEDAEGFTVIRDQEGWFVYARKNLVTGELESSGVPSSHGGGGGVHPRKYGLVPRLRPDQHVLERLAAEADDGGGGQRHLRQQGRRRRAQASREALVAAMASGTREDPYVLRPLIVLLRFADHRDRVLASPEEFSVLFNHKGRHKEFCPTGSVRKVWYDNSHGRLDLNATVVGWIDLPHVESHYSYRPHLKEGLILALEEIAAASSSFHWKDLDSNGDGILDVVGLVHSGMDAARGNFDCQTQQPPEERVWSHASVVSWQTPDGLSLESYFSASGIWADSLEPNNCRFTMARVGVMVHELGHLIGLPDLYGANTFGTGNFDVMGNMWGWDVSQLYPSHLCPWSRLRMGWGEVVHLDHEGLYRLPASPVAEQVYIVRRGFNVPNEEFFALENRHPMKMDRKAPFPGGLALWHIDFDAPRIHVGYPGQVVEEQDELPFPQNGRHNQNALLPADGRYDLEKGQNFGDGKDTFRPGGFFSRVADEVGPNGVATDDAILKVRRLLGGFPTTDSYRGGHVLPTGITIRVLSTPPSKWLLVQLSGRGLLPARECVDSDTFHFRGKLSRGCTDWVAMGKTPKKCQRWDDLHQVFVWQKCRFTCRHVLPVAEGWCP